MNNQDLWVDAYIRFLGDTANHQLHVLYANQKDQTAMLRYLAPGSSNYWADLCINQGWWAFNGDMGAWIVERHLPMVDWTADSIIRDPEYLAGKINVGAHEEFDVKETRKAIEQMKLELKDTPDWFNALSTLLENESWNCERTLAEACESADVEYDTELYLNVPAIKSPTIHWMWACCCIATMMDDELFQLSFPTRKSSYGDEFVAGFKDLKLLAEAKMNQAEQEDQAEVEKASE